ncbi:MAG: putative membrane protein [Cyclobacteriaceae bacterium]|jgi:putative membrane protein
MDYLTVKSLHIIFIVTWFAGMFYIPRIFIYQIEALKKGEPEKSILQNQLSLMAKRLWYIITWPSAVITLILGSLILYLQPQWLSMPFMHVKLTFVLVLYLYHGSLHILFKQLQQGIVKFSSQQLRIWNELSTIILIAVVFLIVKKDQISWIWGILGILGIAVALMIAIRLYKIYRDKKDKN